jgi:cytochrome c oxidase assembly factor CtaG
MPVAVAIATAALATAAFVHGFVRLRRRGRADLAGWDRAALFGMAVALWLFALSPQVDKLADQLLSAHMLEHVLIADAVPALALVAVRGPLFFFLLPAPLLQWLARRSWLRALLSQLLRPSVAFVVWVASIAVWHIPALYDRALENPRLHGLEHATFVLGGVLVWMQLVDPAGRHALDMWQRLGYALALLVGGMALANTLILSYTPLYPAYAEQPDRPFGLSALGDQNLAGLVMLGEQAAALGLFAAILLRRWLNAPLAVESTERHPFAV